MDENLQYLDAHFIPQEILARDTGLDATAIQALIGHGLVPRACYFPDGQGRLTSNLGSCSALLDTSWFHPSTAALIRDADALLGAGAEPGALAARRKRGFIEGYLAELDAMRALGLVEAGVWDDAFSDENSRTAIAQAEYGHWIAGTYALCTRANTPEAVAIKECMVRNVDFLVQDCTPDTLPDADREKLSRYIRLFDHTAALFAPFERASSSRHRLCVAIPARFGLALS